MALFGKLFEKKFCDVCGSEIKLLGNRKLEDGNLCKDCAAKLSRWFDDRRSSTVAQIKEQLAYREENKQRYVQFNTTLSMAEGRLLLDEDQGLFVLPYGSRDDNPDIIAFADVTGCEVDIEDSQDEITRTGSDGKQVSYNPPRYRYSYDFYVDIRVNHKYFDDMRLHVNGSSITVETPETATQRAVQTAARVPKPAAAAPARTAAPVKPGASVRPGTVQKPGAAARPAVAGRPAAAAPAARMTRTPAANVARPMMSAAISAAAFDPTTDPEYVKYYNMAYEIRDALLQVRADARELAAEAAAPKAAVVCPFCGATTMPDTNGCCEYCGGAVSG